MLDKLGAHALVYQAIARSSLTLQKSERGSSSSQLVCNPKTAPVLVLHTEAKLAKVLLLSQNGTVGSDWSASRGY